MLLTHFVKLVIIYIHSHSTWNLNSLDISLDNILCFSLRLLILWRWCYDAHILIGVGLILLHMLPTIWQDWNKLSRKSTRLCKFTCVKWVHFMSFLNSSSGFSLITQGSWTQLELIKFSVNMFQIQLTSLTHELEFVAVLLNFVFKYTTKLHIIKYCLMWMTRWLLIAQPTNQTSYN